MACSVLVAGHTASELEVAVPNRVLDSGSQNSAEMSAQRRSNHSRGQTSCSEVLYGNDYESTAGPREICDEGQIQAQKALEQIRARAEGHP